MSDFVDLNVKLPIRAAVDVLVVGGGPAGIAAAIASARNGAQTMLIERNGYVGGNLTAGLVGPCMTSYSQDGSQQIIRGVFEELVLRLESDGGAIHPSRVPPASPYAGFVAFGLDRVTPFDAEALKLAAQEMCLEAGVELLLHTMVVGARMDGDAVTGVTIASKSGLEAINATVVVDCSADGDVAASAGVEFELGRPSDGFTQAMTLFFRVGNVNDNVVSEYVHSHPEDYRPFSSIVEAGRVSGEFTIPKRNLGLYKTLHDGIWRANVTRVQQLDGTDVADLTTAEIETRRQVAEVMTFFRRRVPGFESCILLDTAATIGVRETRRIIGEYVLTLEDLAQGRAFPDTIALCGYPVDIHSPIGIGGGPAPFETGSAVQDELATAAIYEIPFRCLVPRIREQLLVAGRCVSATHEAQSAIRVMPPAFAMGQAAGTAAAMSVQAGCSPRSIDVADLRNKLLTDGAYLGV